MRVRNSKNERDSELGQYIDRRPKKISEKMLEQKKQTIEEILSEQI